MSRRGILSRPFRHDDSRDERRRIRTLGLSLAILLGTVFPAVAEGRNISDVSKNGVNTPPTATADATHYTSYLRAYRTARMLRQPLLVVLNPADDSQTEPIPIQEIQRTEYRRQLLKSYVVCLVDTGTPYGRKCQEVFGCEKLPYVAVIDKHQKRQIFKTSETFDDRAWTKVLETYQHGERPVSRSTTTSFFGYYCPT